jgi:hypothetical protein
MIKIRESEFEVSEIADKLNTIVENETNTEEIAKAAIQLVLNKVNQYVINHHLMTLDEVADTFQNLLDMINDEKYKPLIDFLGTIGGE